MSQSPKLQNIYFIFHLVYVLRPESYVFIMSSRTLSIGGLTYDLFVEVDHTIVQDANGKHMLQLPLGEKVRIQKVTATCGGGAANTSVGLRRLGCASGCCGVVGSDQWGSDIVKTFENERVDRSALTIVENEPTSFSIIIIADTGERVILTTPGTNTHLQDATFDRDAAANADWVYLNHMQPVSCAIDDDIVALLQSTFPPHLTWNPGGCQIEEGLEAKNIAALVAHTELLLLNKEEALAFTRTLTIDDALKALQKAGCKIACITDGAKGAYATDGKNRYHCSATTGPVVDTTGAGDAFGTGMTWALLRGLDLPTALRAGTINAMSVVGAMGAQAGLLTETEIQSKIANTEPIVTSSSF